MKQHAKYFLLTLAAVLICSLATVAAAQDTKSSSKADGEAPSTLAEALKAGKTTVSLRYRFEYVDQDGIDDTAEASTLRTTLSYGTGSYKGFRLFLEAENVSGIPDDDNYRNVGAGSLSNGVTDRPVVADPELTDFNQVYLEWKRDKTAVRLGRQAINLGNQRFVGAVGWRQHHQSFNAFSLTDQSFGKTKISYHYLDKVHRIFGDSRSMSSHLLHTDFDLGKQNKLTAYGYWLDYDASEGGLVLSSTSTYGLRWAGHTAFDAFKVTYALEAAQQQDLGDNPRDVDADYLHGEVTVGHKPITFKLGYELLSGSSQDGAFSTPLATLHKFNGWADKFLRTPSNGLQDLYAGLNGSIDRFKWAVIYHDFQSDSGDFDYGTEIDALATYKAQCGVVFGLKAAFYDAEDFATDTDKIMFWSAYKFGR